MTTQTEQALENKLISQLVGMKYTQVTIADEADLLKNLKTQLEAHNKTTFSASEFERILNHLSKGDVYNKALVLRDKMRLTRDDNTGFFVEFF